MPLNRALDTSSAAFISQAHYDPYSGAILGLDGRYAMSQQVICNLGGHDFQPGEELLDATAFRAGSNSYTSQNFGECAGEYGASQWSQLGLGLGIL